MTSPPRPPAAPCTFFIIRHPRSEKMAGNLFQSGVFSTLSGWINTCSYHISEAVHPRGPIKMEQSGLWVSLLLWYHIPPPLLASHPASCKLLGCFKKTEQWKKKHGGQRQQQTKSGKMMLWQRQIKCDKKNTFQLSSTLQIFF